MALRKVSDISPLKTVQYNSVEAKNFIEMYEDNIKRSILQDSNYIPSKRFAPSSIRCQRQQWFRLRGTKPDKVSEPDVILNFIADIGTHCHRVIQQNLVNFLGDRWIDIEQYFKNNPPEYDYSLRKSEYETVVTVDDPPVKFSVDGLIAYNGTIYLLEIKTSETNSMRALIGPKQEHLDQIRCYCTVLGIDDAMVVYQDRQYGSFKCFTYHVTESDKLKIVDTFKEVQDKVNRNIAPSALPIGDKWCNSSYCRYYRTCKKWGR